MTITGLHLYPQLTRTQQQEKEMADELMEALPPEEFDQLIESFIKRDDDRIDLPTFFAAMAEIEARRRMKVIELSGTFDQGTVVFDTPAPLPVRSNEIRVGEMRIVLRLRPAT
jgi:hypothetical protein